ncbi:MAG: D-alanyl-D-alanine carboxypeptidase/D-alanyl-D-alanine-endopeptidase, partial [Bacteroidota bacterium]
ADPDLRSASWGVVVIDAKTGQVIAQHDPHRGLTTASTMKAMTTATALAVLGPDFQFQTFLSFDGRIEDSILRGNLYLQGDGDPTLGSDRLREQDEIKTLLAQWVKAVQEAGIKRIEGAVIGDDRIFSSQITPAKWPWEDMGNYYGAGAAGLNIYENQYRLDFQSGRSGTLTRVLRTEPSMDDLRFVNEVIAGPAGSGDNAYIYGAPFTYVRYLRGSIPPNRSSFSIKGSMADPAMTSARWLHEELVSCGISIRGNYTTTRVLWAEDELSHSNRTRIHRHASAPLSEIVKATNEKSINLYAEALAKRLAVAKGKPGSTEAAMEYMEKYWQSHGVDTRGMYLRDGSGLSPHNSVSAMQMALMLKQVYQSGYRSAFVNSLPIAGRSGTLKSMLRGTAAEGRIQAKSGYISGVRCYVGYLDANGSNPRIFAMLANNYDCGAGEMRRKWERLMLAML